MDDLFFPRWRDEAPLSLSLVAAGGGEEPSDADVECVAQRLGVGYRLDAASVRSGARLVADIGARRPLTAIEGRLAALATIIDARLPAARAPE